MTEQDLPETITSCTDDVTDNPVCAGLFGYSLNEANMRPFLPLPEYVRDLEQIPNFAPPSVERFLAQYVRSQIGVTKSSS
ncbi:MAG: hypothetical protein ABJO01_00415 [Parasphingorhabdus sp.]|uniref:hypothetical protein n=1 Tax=Parasphingorhabdus sp. TaxID=2709688 RepID=UPI003296EC65